MYKTCKEINKCIYWLPVMSNKKKKKLYYAMSIELNGRVFTATGVKLNK